jgi:hypothetical protein
LLLEILFRFKSLNNAFHVLNDTAEAKISSK